MSTNAVIGLRKINKDIRYIYCHWDGYPEYAGVVLKYFYNDISKVKKLFELGNLSAIGQCLEASETVLGCVAYIRDLNYNIKENRSLLLKSDLEFNCKNFKYEFDYLYIIDEQTNSLETYKLTDITYTHKGLNSYRIGTLTPINPDYTVLFKQAVNDGTIKLIKGKKH